MKLDLNIRRKWRFVKRVFQIQTELVDWYFKHVGPPHVFHGPAFLIAAIQQARAEHQLKA